MDAALSVILPPFGFLCKAKPLLLQIGGPSLIGVTANDSVSRACPFYALICKFWTRCLRGSSKIAPSAASFDKRSIRTWLD
jgi:hypothetical protein